MAPAGAPELADGADPADCVSRSVFRRGGFSGMASILCTGTKKEVMYTDKKCYGSAGGADMADNEHDDAGGDDGDGDEDDGGADATDDGDDEAKGADAADDGCEGAMGNGSNCYDYERCLDSNYDEDDGEE